MVPDITCRFVHAKQRDWHQNYLSVWGALLKPGTGRNIPGQLSHIKTRNGTAACSQSLGPTQLFAKLNHLNVILERPRRTA